MAGKKVALASGNHVPINVHSEYEVAYWVEKLRLTREELRGAVAAVGPMADDIEQYPGSHYEMRSIGKPTASTQS